MSKISVTTIAGLTSGGAANQVKIASGNAFRVEGGDLVVASGNTALTGNLNTSGTSTLSGLVTASAGVAVGGTGAANTIDDYEEGTWTPSIGGDATYTSQLGKYTKVGRFVHADFDFTINVKGTGSPNVLSGFPFAMGSYGGVMSGYCGYYTGLALTVTSLACYIISNTSNMYFTGHNVGAAANIGNAISIFQNSTRVLGSVAYYVAQ